MSETCDRCKGSGWIDHWTDFEPDPIPCPCGGDFE